MNGHLYSDPIRAFTRGNGKKPDGVNFETIALEFPAAGNSRSDYSYSDKNVTPGLT
jgi:hypothetical protein